MRLYRILFAALTLAVIVPAAAEAQINIVTARRGILGFASELIIGPNGDAQRVIVDVVKDSPAERAGVVVGDTLVRFNGLQPVGEVLGALQPGDTVVLRLRRGGAERNVSVVAAQRPYEYVQSFNVLPDSIRRSVAVMVDAVRAGIDTVMFPRIRIERIHGDSVIVFHGNERILTAPRMGHLSPDSVRSIVIQRSGELQRIFGDSSGFRIRIGPDSLTHFRFGPDSLTYFRFGPDSIAALARRGAYVLRGDSSRFRLHGDSGRFEIFTAAPGGLMTWSMDSIRGTMRPAELMAANLTIGFRAIAGAELSELNPALGEYFGTHEGVLVLNAAEGTPAQRAGLSAGDVIVRANGEAVTSIASLRRAVAARPGSPTSLEVLRRGTRLTVELGRQ